MKNIIKFIKNHKIISILCAIAVIVVVAIIIPLIINWLYTIPAFCSFFAVEWEANDALSFYGNFLGFLGTVVFSGLALWQNQVIQDANETHTLLLEKMERKKNEPFIFVKTTIAYGNASRLRIEIKNISDNLAEKLQASNFRIEDETGKIVWEDKDVIKNEYLLSKTTWELQWENPQVTSNKHRFAFDIKYKDVFNNEYTCLAVGVFENKKTLPTFTVIMKK